MVKSNWQGLALIVEKRKACVWAMANFDSSRVSYSSLSKVVEKDNNNAQFYYVDDCTDSPWDSNSQSSPPDHTFYDDDFAVGGEGYDSSDDTCNSVQPYNNNNNNSMHHPEVNLKNVHNVIFAIVTGRSKLLSLISNQQALLPTSNV